jgi:hypothetical protein
MARTRAGRLYRTIVLAGMAVPSACGGSMDETAPTPVADSSGDTTDGSSPDTKSDAGTDSTTSADTTPDVTDAVDAADDACKECFIGDACVPCIK